MPPPASTFRTTRWSLVVRAQERHGSEARSALGELCALYWYPLYALLRRRGHDEHDALDLVQGFLARLLEKGDLAAQPGTGRFRTYVIAALQHFVHNEARAARAARRGGGAAAISLDATEAEARYALEPCDTATPERLLERRWAIALLERAVARLRAESEARGRGRVFAELQDALAGDTRASYAVKAAALGTTEGAVKVAVHRLRQRLRELVRAEVEDTVADPGEVEDELRWLLGALGG